MRENICLKSKRSQVWIETVVYTLIAFVILGAILGFAKPKIEQLQDKSIIEQSIGMLEDIDATIEEIQAVSGNKREIELSIKKGSLNIDAPNEQIIFEIESQYTYSEPGIQIQKGSIEINNEKIGKINKINATINYAGKYNLTLNNEDKSELLVKSSAPYKLFISNEGKENDLIKINFELS
ncbi:MAG: hypothetical protein Q8Q86_00705 [Candidatus Daviesbacteria bacterium]|nr:hypothetical protein [Candidatus Daviesbacteria bacterium]